MNDNEIKEYLMQTLNTTPELIKNKLATNKKIKKREVYYELKNKIDRFLKEDTEIRFFTMPGIRGTGKTTILYQLYDHLYNENKINNKQILYLDLERLKNNGPYNLLNYLDIYIKDINEDNYYNNEPMFIFIDESQYANNWGSVGKVIFDETTKVFLIFTGSDALNLESDIYTYRRSLKKEIYPLNFKEYLHLKYGIKFQNNIKDTFYKLIFTGEVEPAIKLENTIKLNQFMETNRNMNKEWENYLKYGEFPFFINKKQGEIHDLTLNVKNSVIEKDIDTIHSFNSQTRLITYQLLNILALQKPADISHEKLANTLDTSKKTISNVLNVLEKTELIFHIEPYGSGTKRNRKSWEYYFISTQIKSSIIQDSGIATSNINEYNEILLKNHVASTLFKMKKELKPNFGLFYDTRKGGVNFIIKTLMGDTIPIEVGIGKKNKKQIKNSINKYNSKYGIIISNKTSIIEKEDNIIYIPPLTFSLI